MTAGKTATDRIADYVERSEVELRLKPRAKP
jgi:hypothetical protein